MQKFTEMYRLLVWLILMYDVFIVKFINFIFKRIHEDWKHKIWRRGTLSPSLLLQLMNSSAPCMSDTPWFYTLRKKLWKLTQCLSTSTFDFIVNEFVYTCDFSHVSYGGLLQKPIPEQQWLKNPYFTLLHVWNSTLNNFWSPTTQVHVFPHITPVSSECVECNIS